MSRFPFHLWPLTAHLRRGRLHLHHLDLAEWAQEVGTPLYLYDAATLDEAIAAYRWGSRAWPGPSLLTYAAKAWLSQPLAQALHRRQVGMDVVSEGELGIALAAGFSPQRLHLHGNNKAPALLQQAIAAGIGAIVVDNLDEVERLEQVVAGERAATAIPLWLRLNPNLLAPTHRYRQTGHHGAKFGLSRDEALTAAERIRRHPRLSLQGLHSHIGSGIFDLTPFLAACDHLIAFAADLHAAGHDAIRFLSPGGGLGQPYHPTDPQLNLAEATNRIASHCAAAWTRYNQGVATAQHPAAPQYPAPPTLVLEPGRSLIARAGVAVYTVGSVRHLPDGSRIIAVDGSMADNIRPALYGARYTACLPAAPLAPPTGPARIVGPLCESGDLLIEDLPLPSVRPGDILAVPVSGAYHLSMASNYNAALLPPVFWLEAGCLSLVQRRQTVADLLRRDLPLPAYT